MTCLRTEQLSITIAGRKLCEKLDWQIHPGETWGLLGVNGSGKTTLLHTLAGLRPPDSGSVLIDDHLVSELPRKQVAQALSLLFQDHQDSFPGTVLEAAMTGRHPYLHGWQFEGARDHAIVNEALQRVELDKLGERDVLTLSGGERQRLAIATQMVQATNICLLDEPNNHLDPHQQIRVMDSISEHARTHNIALCMSSHDLNLAVRYCSHLAVMMDGGEVLTGTADALLNEETLSRLYQYPMQRIEQHGRVAWLPK